MSVSPVVAGWIPDPAAPAGVWEAIDRVPDRLSHVRNDDAKGALMSKIEESVEVAVPVSTAYNQWTQFEEFPRFMDAVERIEQRTPTLTHWVTKVDGVSREFDAEITEQRPDERVAWTTVAGEIRQAGVVTFHRLDDTRTKIMLQLDHDPQGITDTVGDKLGFVRHQAKGDLRNFKEFIEARGTETGAWRGTA